MNKDIIQGINNKVTTFESGAVRDIQEDKGRMDLVPLPDTGLIYDMFENVYDDMTNSSYSVKRNTIFNCIHNYLWTADTNMLRKAICYFISLTNQWNDTDSAICCNALTNAILEVSLHYKRGLEKYGERNWEKGIPLHSFMDSACRHYIKYLGGWKDERHDLAFIWNLWGCIYTQEHIKKDTLNDIPAFTMSEYTPYEYQSTVKENKSTTQEDITDNSFKSAYVKYKETKAKIDTNLKNLFESDNIEYLDTFND